MATNHWEMHAVGMDYLHAFATRGVFRIDRREPEMPSANRTNRMPPRIETRSAPRSRDRSFVASFDAIHRRALADKAWHAEPIVVLLVAVTSLALLNFLSTAPVLAWLLSLPDDSSIAVEWASAFWVGCRVLCYFLIPLFTLCLLRRRPRDFGLRLRNTSRHLSLYLALALLMVPVVVVCSWSVAFQRYYPFHDYAGESLQGLVFWESLYATQFIALEFFYRGFLLFTLERYIGVYSIFVMVIPYCMVHFGKPFVETLAAIPAGVILGTLALRTRSIWPGALLHITVGWSMDLLSLWQRGLLAPMFVQ
jgi:membrane protease YdiL (CAAX protease family)